MARAKGVWVVKGAYGEPDTIRAVFTVKHECAKWLKAQAEPRSYIVDRYQDGDPEAGHVRVHLGELFGERNLCTHLTDSGIGWVISASLCPILLSVLKSTVPHSGAGLHP